MSVRERLVVALTAVSLVATLALGSAAAYALTQGGPRTYTVTGGVAQAEVPGSNAGSSLGAPGASATAGPAGPAGGSSATGGRSSSGSAPGINNTENFVHGGVITVGGIFDETGALDATVERDTVRAYFDQINAQGGINGSKLQLLACDSRFDPSAAHQCSQTLLSQGVLAIVGWTSVSGEQNETFYLDTQTSSCPQCGIPIFGGLGVDAEFQSPLSFPVAPPLGTQGYAGGSRACQLGYKKAAVVYLNAPSFKSANDGILKGLATCGQSPSGNDDVGVDIGAQQDYDNIVAPWLTDGTESVLAGLDPFSMGRLYQSLERDQWQHPVTGSGLDKTSAESHYGSLFKGVQSFTPVLEAVGHESNPAMADYLNTVKQYYPSQVQALDVYCVEQWIAAHVFVAALKAIKGSVSRQALVSAAQNLQNFDTGGLTQPLSYGKGGRNNPNHWVEWMQNTDGQADGWQTESGWIDIPYNPF